MSTSQAHQVMEATTLTVRHLLEGHRYWQGCTWFSQLQRLSYARDIPSTGALRSKTPPFDVFRLCAIWTVNTQGTRPVMSSHTFTVIQQMKMLMMQKLVSIVLIPGSHRSASTNLQVHSETACIATKTNIRSLNLLTIINNKCNCLLRQNEYKPLLV